MSNLLQSDCSMQINLDKILLKFWITFFSNSFISGTKGLRHQQWAWNWRFLRELNCKPIFEQVTPSRSSGKQEDEKERKEIAWLNIVGLISIWNWTWAEYRNQNLDQDQEDRCEIYLENCNLWDAQVGGRSWAERRAAGEGPALDPRTPRHDFQWVRDTWTSHSLQPKSCQRYLRSWGQPEEGQEQHKKHHCAQNFSFISHQLR